MVAALLSRFSTPGSKTGNVTSGSTITSTDTAIALVWAASLGFTEILRVLLAANADLHAARNQATATAISQTINSYTGTVGQVDVESYVYPLSAAAFMGYISVVSVLLDAGADVDAKWGEALYVASMRGDSKLVNVLLDAGAKYREKALFVAAELGSFDIVAVLLDAGADVHSNNNLALHLAAAWGHHRCVAQLIDAGADVHSQQGEALRRAASEGHDKVVAVLLGNLGARPGAT